MSRGRPRSAVCRGGGSWVQGGVHPRPPISPHAETPSSSSPPRKSPPPACDGHKSRSSGQTAASPPALPPTPEPSCNRAAPSRPPIPLTGRGSSPRVATPRDPGPRSRHSGHRAVPLGTRAALAAPPTARPRRRRGDSAGQWRTPGTRFSDFSVDSAPLGLRAQPRLRPAPPADQWRAPPGTPAVDWRRRDAGGGRGARLRRGRFGAGGWSRRCARVWRTTSGSCTASKTTSTASSRPSSRCWPRWKVGQGPAAAETGSWPAPGSLRGLF